MIFWISLERNWYLKQKILVHFLSTIKRQNVILPSIVHVFCHPMHMLDDWLVVGQTTALNQLNIKFGKRDTYDLKILSCKRAEISFKSRKSFKFSSNFKFSRDRKMLTKVVFWIGSEKVINKRSPKAVLNSWKFSLIFYKISKKIENSSFFSTKNGEILTTE